MAVVEGINVGYNTSPSAGITALGNIVNGIINTAKNVGTVLTNPNQSQVNQAIQQIGATFGLNTPSYTPPVYGPPAPVSYPISQVGLQAPGTVYPSQQQQFNATTFGQTVVYPVGSNQPVTVNVTVPTTVSLPQQQTSINIPELFTNLAATVLPNFIKTVAPETSGIVNVVQNALNRVIDWQNNTSNQFSTAIDSVVRNFGTLVNNTVAQSNAVLETARSLWGQQVNTRTHEASTLTEDFINKFSQEQLDVIRRNSDTEKQFIATLTEWVDREKKILPALDEAQQRALNERIASLQDTQLDLFNVLAQIAKIVLRWTNDPQLVGKSLVDSSTNLIGSVIKSSVEDYIKGYSSVFRDIDNGKIEDYKDLIKRLGTLNADKNILWSAVNLVSVINLFFSFLSSLGAARTQRLGQLAMAEVQPSLLTPDAYIEYIKRNPSHVEFTTLMLHRLGLDDAQIRILQDVAVKFLSLGEYVQANLRGIIKDDEYDSALNVLGYDSETKKIINELRYFYPPVQDLIQMAVHEVFSPDDRKRLSLDNDYPAIFTEIARKGGISEQWARNYWANHWQLPSPQQVFEMLHRADSEPELRGFSLSDVDRYLKAADYAPIWRDKLRAISYLPLGRIDIRRIYKQGGKDRQWLMRHHLAIGYNQVDAEDLTQFTVDTQLPEDDTDISRLNDSIETTIKSRYIAGAINDVQAIEFLRLIGKSEKYIGQWLAHVDLLKKVAGYENETSGLKEQLNGAAISALRRGNISNAVARHILIDNGLTDQQADMRITFANLQYQVELKAKAQDVYTQQYAIHNIDENTFSSALAAYGFSNTEIENALKEASLERVKKTKKPSEAQIEKWYKNGTINELQLANELRGLGYDDRYVAIIIKDIVPQEGIQQIG